MTLSRKDFAFYTSASGLIIFALLCNVQFIVFAAKKSQASTIRREEAYTPPPSIPFNFQTLFKHVRHLPRLLLPLVTNIVEMGEAFATPYSTFIHFLFQSLLIGGEAYAPSHPSFSAYILNVK